MALLADIAVTGAVPDRIAEVPDLVAALLESLLRGAGGRRSLGGGGDRAGRLRHRPR